ncbi:MAG: hypothetical protein Q8936_22965 [Bacillota bacterium]|nr:hypothetical protein [Bacillota bacterium]
MKKTLMALVLSITIATFVGCNNSSNVKNSSNQSTVTQSNETNSTQDKTPTSQQNTSSEDKVVITNIDAWSHPTKDVFKSFNVVVSKVELTNNKTYPIFYVTLSNNVDSKHKVFYENLFKSIAVANGFWDYRLVDEKESIDLQIQCDKKTKTVSSVTYNNDKSYFSNLEVDNTAVENDLISYLQNTVPEVKSFVEAYSKNTNDVKAIIYVDRQPDPSSKNVYLRDYYGIYVGESHPDHNVNIYRFAINKDTKNIMFYDVVNDKYMTLDEWRASRNKN